jgi:hypothetical protein
MQMIPSNGMSSASFRRAITRSIALNLRQGVSALRVKASLVSGGCAAAFGHR